MKRENLKTTKIHQLVRKSLMIFVALSMVACSSDDDSDGSTSNAPDGVPSGLIVPESERAFVLTGSNEAKARLTSKANGKTWKYDYGEFMYDGCDEEDETNINDNLFVTFKPNGTIEYSREDGNIFETRPWDWGPSKNSIFLDGNSEVKFFFSELNNNQVVYYSEQSNLGCNLTTYEVLNQPSTE